MLYLSLFETLTKDFCFNKAFFSHDTRNRHGGGSLCLLFGVILLDKLGGVS